MTGRPQAAARGGRRHLLPLAGFACLLLATSCGSSEPSPTAGAPTVVATTSIWADVVANVACEGQVSVQTLVPSGGDPHAFEPSLRDRRELEQAALVVANGLGLEEGLEDTIEAAEDAATPVFRVGDHVDGIISADDNSAEDGADPHIWFDPVRVADALPSLAAEIESAAELGTGALDDCAAEYRAELEALDVEVTRLLSAVPAAQRYLVTSHDSLAYFADRYDFEILGTMIPAPSSLAETNPAQLEALAVLIDEAGVPAIFADAEHSADDIEALADRVGDIDVVSLSTGGLGQEGSGADTYVGFLRRNAELIADALG